MRVIAGEFRSRRLESLPGMNTRPTPDRLRETLFNILAPRIVGSVFMDAWAGTGAVGIEALSRGAKQAVFIEKNRAALGAISANLTSLRIQGRARIIRGVAAQHLRDVAADIVFADPPYTEPAQYDALFQALALHPPGLAIVQHSPRQTVPDECGSLKRTRTVRQGDNALSFFEIPQPVSSPEPNHEPDHKSDSEPRL